MYKMYRISKSTGIKINYFWYKKIRVETQLFYFSTGGHEILSSGKVLFTEECGNFVALC